MEVNEDDIKFAYFKGWNDAFEYRNPLVKEYSGPHGPMDGFNRYLKELKEQEQTDGH